MMRVWERSAGIQKAGSSVSHLVGSVTTRGLSAPAAGSVLPGAAERMGALVASRRSWRRRRQRGFMDGAG
jgi:hypothetical protein